MDATIEEVAPNGRQTYYFKLKSAFAVEYRSLLHNADKTFQKKHAFFQVE